MRAGASGVVVGEAEVQHKCREGACTRAVTRVQHLCTEQRHTETQQASQATGRMGMRSLVPKVQKQQGQEQLARKRGDKEPMSGAHGAAKSQGQTALTRVAEQGHTQLQEDGGKLYGRLGSVDAPRTKVALPRAWPWQGNVRGEGRLHRWGALGRRGNGCRWGPGDLIWGRGGVRARPRRLELV